MSPQLKTKTKTYIPERDCAKLHDAFLAFANLLPSLKYCKMFGKAD